jgi:hypothetical protein
MASHDTPDQLRELWRMQKSLNERIGVRTDGMNEEEKTKWTLNYCLAMSQELAELTDSVPWKWWAKYQKFDEQNARVEVVDLFHFLISLAQTLGLSADDVFDAYVKKKRGELPAPGNRLRGEGRARLKAHLSLACRPPRPWTRHSLAAVQGRKAWRVRVPADGAAADGRPSARQAGQANWGAAHGTADGWKEWRQCMDKADPEKRIGMIVDEWGTWHDVEPSANSGFLYQQNSLRDALVAGIDLNLFNQHLRPGENGEHRPDHQRASGHDPDRQGKADRHSPPATFSNCMCHTRTSRCCPPN